ncbi:MAG TPA: di-heme oxidoredictase family protein [Acidimicrobiales bacterium]
MAVTLAACTGDDTPTGAVFDSDRPAELTPEELADQGGDATVEVFGGGAFAQPVPGLSSEQRRDFAVGNNFFNDNWVTAPASTEARDGLGPVFNAQSCSSCHFRDGRGQPAADADDPERGLLLRLSVLDGEGRPQPHPRYGDQLQDRAIRGVPTEGTIVITTTDQPGRYADGTTYSLAAPTYEVLDADGVPFGPDVLISPRVAPPMFGVGLLEGVPADSIIAGADPSDDDGDGISGRAHLLAELEPGGRAGDDGPVLGRFGWKAAVRSVHEQNATAFVNDIGITSSLFDHQPCHAGQRECEAAPDGGAPEIEDRKLEQVTFYTRTLGVPARRDVGTTDTSEGQELFGAMGCTGCHLPELTTGPSDIAALDEQVIRPYTDLLLHDMGPGLADGRPDGDASGSEWRTPPLWGIGLTETVNGHTRFLHDGRARGIAEAILWHGGEAEAARDRFKALDADSRAAVIAFLESL